MKIVTKLDRLIILFTGMERFWALKTHIEVAADDINTITWNESLPKKLPGFYIKAPGTNIPLVFSAGSFWSKGGWEFWYLDKKKPGELIIATTLKKYKFIRLSTDSATALTIKNWLQNHQLTKDIA